MRSLLILLLILASASVLIGCLFKIQHWPVANVLIGGGLITEVVCAGVLVVRSLRRKGSGIP